LQYLIYAKQCKGKHHINTKDEELSVATQVMYFY